MEINEPQTMDWIDGNLEASDSTRDCKLLNNDVEKNLLRKDFTVESLAECPEAVEGLIETNCEMNTSSEKKKIWKIKKAKNLDNIQNMEPTALDAESTENVAEKNLNEVRKRKRSWNNKAAKNNEKTPNAGQLDGILNFHFSDGNLGEAINEKTTEKGCTSQESEISVRKSSLPGLMHDKECSLVMCKDEETDVSIRKESSLSDLFHGKETLTDLWKETVVLPDEFEVSNRGSSDVVEERPEHVLSPMGVDLKFIPCERQLGHHLNQMAAENPKPENRSNEVNDEIIVYEGQSSSQGRSIYSNESQLSNHPNQLATEKPKIENGLREVNKEIIVYEGRFNAQGRSIFCTSNVEVIQQRCSVVNGVECLSKDLGQYPRLSLFPPIKRKLIVLDVNGLLANIVMPAPKDCRGDVHILGRAIFRRPFCDDFLKFCFLNFDVGVWSSRSKRIIERVVDYLLGDLKDKLLFCWDMTHSTQTGFNTLENIHKPLVFKELKKIWDNDDPSLPWKSGDYDDSNTLLLDDSPYKALLNPLHTSIFPTSYHYKDKNDNSLGPGGDLRVYLEGLLTSENVRRYVEQHPFGQSAINETNLSWGFYSGVLQTMSNRYNTPIPLLQYDARIKQLPHRYNRYTD